MKYSTFVIGLITAFIMSACGGGSGESGFGTGDCPLLGGVKPFGFNAVSAATLNTSIISNEITFKCGSDLDIRISGGSYSINGSSFTDAPGKISNGQRLRIRIQSAGTYGTASTAGLVIGDWAPFSLNLVTGSFRVTTEPGDPANAPVASILSPLDNATVNASRILVTGQASDPDGIAEILVNGEPATSNDGFLNWTANVPLVFGANTITVSTADTYLNINATAGVISIDNLAVGLVAPIDIAVDEAGSRVLVLDRQSRALIEIDMATSAQAVLSDSVTPNDLTPFTSPQRIALNAAGNKAWIIDRGYEDLIVVDLVTGSRSLLVDTTSADPGISLVDARDITIDEISNNALLLVGNLNSNVNDTQIVSVDLANGARSILSNETIPNADNPLGFLFDEMSIVFDRVGFRLIVLQPGDSVAVDPLTGLRSVFSDWGFSSAIDATLDYPGNRVLILSRVNSTLYTAALANGDVESLWSVHHGGNPQRIALDSPNDRALILYTSRSEVFAFDMVTGDAAIVY